MNKQEKGAIRDFYEAWFASNIKRMPMSLADTIWPENAEEKILQMFMFAVKAIRAMPDDKNALALRKEQEIHPVGVFEYDALLESWLYELVKGWVEQSNLSDIERRELKRMLFDVAMYA